MGSTAARTTATEQNTTARSTAPVIAPASDAPSIVIIGGGVAGLAAGIFGQANGFRTTIVEKHTILAGE